MPRVKISGITNPSDAKWAAILGVEFMSISLEEGGIKKISSESAKEILDMLPSYTEVVAELGEIGDADFNNINKLDFNYIQFKSSEVTDSQILKDKLNNLDLNIILEINSNFDRIDLKDLNASFIQLNISDVMEELELKKIEEKFDMEKIIIQGDFEIADIKKYCEILHPYAWSIKRVIERSPRRIDYDKMKEYIREISLL